MSATDTEADDDIWNDTTDKTKRLVIYPEGYVDVVSFLNVVQDRYSTTRMETSSRTTTTYMMSVDGVKCDITEEQFDRWKDNNADDVEVWEKEETNETRKRKYPDAFIAKNWFASVLGEYEIGEAERDDGSVYWRTEHETLMGVPATVKDCPLVKKLPEQEPDGLYEDEDEEYPAIVVKFRLYDFPTAWEDDLNEAIGKAGAEIERVDQVKAVRPVNCFEVEETKTVCPRV